jgi:hypothetical protein
MPARTKYIEELTVYNITALTGYKGSEIEAPVTDEKCLNYFNNNMYSSLPDKNSSDPLSANDLSAIFNYKSYANADAAKAGVLSADYISWIDSNAESATYSWNNGKLKISLLFADTSNSNTFFNGIKNDNKRTFLEAGTAVSTVNS